MVPSQITAVECPSQFFLNYPFYWNNNQHIKNLKMHTSFKRQTDENSRWSRSGCDFLNSCCAMSLLAPPPAAVAPPGTSPSTFSDDMAPPQLSFTSTSLPSSDLSTEVVGLMNSPTGTPGVSSMVSKQPAASTASVSPLSASNLIGALQSPNTFVKGLMENEQDDDIDYSKSLIEVCFFSYASFLTTSACRNSTSIHPKS